MIVHGVVTFYRGKEPLYWQLINEARIEEGGCYEISVTGFKDAKIEGTLTNGHESKFDIPFDSLRIQIKEGFPK
jgi:hypothetical protein